MPSLAAAGFTVPAPDLRGLSDSAPAEDGFAKTNVAEDVRAIVLDLGLGPAFLVGTDIGAMVAIAYALKHPDEVARLVLAESVLPGFGLEGLMNPATGGYWRFGFPCRSISPLPDLRQGSCLMPFYKMMSAVHDAEEVAESTFLPLSTGSVALRGGFQHYGPSLADGKANRAVFAAKLPMPVLGLNGERGLVGLASLALSRAFACAMPSTALATLAAYALRRRVAWPSCSSSGPPTKPPATRRSPP